MIKQEQKIPCPICGGNNTKKKGYRETKVGLRRICFCKDCRKKFTPPGFIILKTTLMAAPCLGCLQPDLGTCDPRTCDKLIGWLMPLYEKQRGEKP